MTRRVRERPDHRVAHRASLPSRILPTLLACYLLLQSGCITTGPHQWLQNGLKVGPEYGRPPAPVAAEWIQAERPARAIEPPARRRLVECLRRPHAHRTGPPRLRAEPRSSHRRRPGPRSSRGPGDLRRQLASAIAASDRVIQPGQPEPEHAHHQPARQNAAAWLHVVLELVLRLQPELGA